MLEANKSRWFERVFALYNRNLLKRRFNSFRVSGLKNLQNKTPQIVYANHSSWWDGLVAFEISRAVQADSFVMMEERQLRKLFLFRRLGAFSVVRENPRRAVESLNYAVKVLREQPNRTLWIFPQGEIVPNDARPLRFYQGLARTAERVEMCSVVPFAVRYEFLGEFKPDVFVRVGEPERLEINKNSDAKLKTKFYENQLTELLDHLKQDIITNNLTKYENFFLAAQKIRNPKSKI